MYRWFLLGSNVSNVDLWEDLHAALRARAAPTVLRHVYSQIGIVGNERADVLANSGHIGHPARLQFLCEQRAHHGVSPVILCA